ncbi:MAG TPA: Tim44-like domain-containing protein [Burkholderiales bacterium]|nr:Tim44-like domain-containing protein [Burkholderiales bacterium]
MKQTALKKFVLLLVLALVSPGLASFDAHAAKRLGSGSSLSKQREAVTRPAPVPPPALVPSPAPAGSTWPGLFAGLAAGGLLAALFTGGAFNGIRFADIAMLALLFGAVFFIFRMLRKKPVNEPMQYAALGAETMPSLPARMFGGMARPAPYAVGFEIEPFLKNAKASFIRLQAANDSANLDVIRDYTTPEMLAALKKQIEARGGEPCKTDIVTLDAEVLEVAIEDDLAVASVRFSGLLREKDFGGPAQPFYEIWNVQKRLNEPESVWLLAAIQQAHRIVHA